MQVHKVIQISLMTTKIHAVGIHLVGDPQFLNIKVDSDTHQNILVGKYCQAIQYVTNLECLVKICQRELDNQIK